MSSKIRLKVGAVEVEYEGSEEYLREGLPELVERLVDLHGQTPALSERVSAGEVAESDGGQERDETDRRSSDPVASIAEKIGVEPASVRGAFSPRTEDPYLKIDQYYWAELKKNTPKAGKNAVPPEKLAGTLMGLWFDEVDLGKPALSQISEVVRNSNLREGFDKRKIENCDWLQIQGEEVVINPAEIGRALSLAKAFCSKSEPTT